MSQEIEQSEIERTKSKGAVGPRSIRGRLVAGVLIIIPLGVTAILMKYVYGVTLSVGATAVNWMARFFEWLFGTEPSKEAWIDPAEPKWWGITMAVGLTFALLYLLGWLGSNVVGRRFIDAIESLLERIPLVDTVYGAMKRMIQALSGVGKAEKEQRVVLVEFPNENMKAIAFMTNTFTDLNSGQKFATVYVPTTPNPTSGYMEIVPIDRITQTDWGMEEALSMILSGGATTPPNVRLQPSARESRS